MAFSLSERVLFGLLAVDDRELRALLAAFDQIEANPSAGATPPPWIATDA